VQKIHTQFFSTLIAIALSFTIFTQANAGIPDEIKKAGEKFLAENAKKPNIKTTASGLQYEVLTEGTGKTKPTATSNVTVHYKGTTIDGKEFDSSYSRGEPTSFPLNGVIPGWTEGVQLMTEGAKYRFFIPPNLAYGESGAGSAIGPNETLIFEVELIKINQ
jgi:FKBP-type peptidyl-prolyl cis-trans isomerase FkpA